jgi:hypothetical protein
MRPANVALPHNPIRLWRVPKLVDIIRYQSHMVDTFRIILTVRFTRRAMGEEDCITCFALSEGNLPIRSQISVIQVTPNINDGTYLYPNLWRLSQYM